MSENTPHDPILNAAFNAALEWAANWITGPQMEGHSAEVIEFAKNMAMSLRAGKREVGFQQNFFDAVRSDPYMPIAEKEFWLSQEVRPTPLAVDVPSAVVNHCVPVNGVHASWCTGHESASQ